MLPAKQRSGWLFQDLSLKDVEFIDVRPIKEKKKKKTKAKPITDYLILLAFVGRYGLFPLLILTGTLLAFGLIPYQITAFVVWLSYLNILLYYIESIR